MFTFKSKCVICSLMFFSALQTGGQSKRTRKSANRQSPAFKLSDGEHTDSENDKSTEVLSTTVKSSTCPVAIPPTSHLISVPRTDSERGDAGQVPPFDPVESCITTVSKLTSPIVNPHHVKTVMTPTELGSSSESLFVSHLLNYLL